METQTSSGLGHIYSLGVIFTIIPLCLTHLSPLKTH